VVVGADRTLELVTAQGLVADEEYERQQDRDDSDDLLEVRVGGRQRAVACEALGLSELAGLKRVGALLRQPPGF